MATTARSVPHPSTTPATGVLRFVPSLYQVALIAILGAVMIVALAPRLDTDFWWHLKDGAYIAAHHVVPSKDYMSYTLVGHSWTDHEWFAELILYWTYRIAGLWGPIAFFSCVICATFGMVYANMVQRSINRVLATFIVAAAFMASSASWGPRIQMLTLFFLAAFGLVLQRFQVTRNRRLLLMFPGLMLVWTNLHGGFVLGIVFLVITLAGEWLNRVTRRDGCWSSAELKMLAFTLLGTGATTVVNPNGLRQLLYPLTFVLPNAYTNLIEESASPNFHMPVMVVFEVMILLLVAAVVIGRPQLNWTHLFVVLPFTHLALSQVRNVAVWAVVVSPILAAYLAAAAPQLIGQFPRLRGQSRPVRGRLGPIMNLTLLAMVAVVYMAEAIHFINPASLRQAETDNYPAGAITYMQKHQLPRHVFASYGWGGYLLWKTFPQYRDYMDSRADTLYTNKILYGYLAMYSAKPGWRTTLAQNGVQTVLVERTAPLAQVLMHEPGWSLKYQDNLSALFARH